MQVGINSIGFFNNRTTGYTRIASFHAPAASPSVVLGNADKLDVDNWVGETIAQYGISGANKSTASS